MNYAPNDSISTPIATSRNFQLDDEQLRVTLSKMYQEIAYAVNTKENSVYETVEILTAQQYFTIDGSQNKRYVFRTVFNFGAITAGTSITITHNISNITQCVHIYGSVVTAVPDFRPIPYASVSANTNIEVKTSSTQITIANGSSSPNITSGTLVLEYLKQ